MCVATQGVGVRVDGVGVASVRVCVAHNASTIVVPVAITTVRGAVSVRGVPGCGVVLLEPVDALPCVRRVIHSRCGSQVGCAVRVRAG